MEMFLEYIYLRFQEVLQKKFILQICYYKN